MGFLASAVLPADAYQVCAIQKLPHDTLNHSLLITWAKIEQHRYGCLIVAASGSFSCIPPLLGWLSSNLNTTAAAGLAIALNISFGAPGQIVGVWIYKSDEAKKGYPTGHWTNAGLLLFVAVVCILLQLYYAHMNRRLRRQPGAKLYAYWISLDMISPRPYNRLFDRIIAWEVRIYKAKSKSINLPLSHIESHFW